MVNYLEDKDAFQTTRGLVDFGWNIVEPGTPLPKGWVRQSPSMYIIQLHMAGHNPWFRYTAMFPTLPQLKEMGFHKWKMFNYFK